MIKLRSDRSSQSIPMTQIKGSHYCNDFYHIKSRVPSRMKCGHRKSTIALSSEKPIVRTPRPQHFNEYLLEKTSRRKGNESKKVRFQAEATEKQWLTTMMKEYNSPASCSPKDLTYSTLERFADPVNYKARETGATPSLWQIYAREWDIKQLRESRSPKSAGTIFPQILHSQNTMEQQSTGKLSEQKGRVKLRPWTEQLNKCPPLQFTHPTPGYGGYVPRYPIEPKYINDQDCVTAATLCSTSRRTYRCYPSEEYKELTFSHRGPLSTTVTLTAPYNPFNKVEHS